MDLIRQIWKLFLYAGVEKEEYRQLLPSIRKENEVLLRVFSPLAGVMFFLLFIVSMLSGGFTTVNAPTYLTCGIIMLLILLCVRCFAPKHPKLIMLLVYVFEIVLYVFGIHVSMLHAERPAVSAVAFLLVSPLLFYDRPVRLSALLAAVVAVFCGIVVRSKTPEVVESDVWNMITFGIVSIAATVFIMKIKCRALAQSRQIEIISQTDLLTGIKNRNHFEKLKELYPELCRSSIICVYADVNGLHETNNKQGHQAGDRMLTEVAAKMRQCFGLEHTYRVGGDEFVAFELDGRPEKTLSELDRIRQELNEEGYHVSFGLSVQDKTQGALNMRELLKAAESSMFSDKREFYRQPENNRRGRL
ncbi:MAG: diguanylate cyclase [Oscillospiraceae bacterium]|nr:diguanylate cyclase [Oscillospiraceae bacterium]